MRFGLEYWIITGVQLVGYFFLLIWLVTILYINFHRRFRMKFELKYIRIQVVFLIHGSSGTQF